MISNDAQFFQKEAEILYSEELTATIQRFQSFQKDVKNIMVALLLENERLINEVERLNFLLQTKSEEQ